MARRIGRGARWFMAVVCVAVAACGDSGGPPRTQPDTAMVPLIDLGTRTYLGASGELYPGGNAPPAVHDSVGRARAARIQPRDASGSPTPTGTYVLLSVGMSNTTQEFCSQSAMEPCDSWSFMGQAAADPAVNRSTLAIVNGARGGQSAETWDSPADQNYDRVRDSVLAPRGLSEQQVQIVWVKQANPGPAVSLPSSQADAYALEAALGRTVRALRTRYPNLQQIFFSSRTYGGYATTKLNPEPFAYESGFAVKWLIQAQIDQMAAAGTVDPIAGDLSYETVAPWIGWGPYLWASGATPRSDGLTWLRGDFANDGTHPSTSGRQKVGTLLLLFFKSSPHSACWFLAGESCR